MAQVHFWEGTCAVVPWCDRCVPSLLPSLISCCWLCWQYAALTIALVVLVLARTCDQTLYYRLNFSYSYFVWCVVAAHRPASSSCCARLVCAWLYL